MPQPSRDRRPANRVHVCIAIGLLALAQAAWAERPAGKAGVDWGDPKGQDCVDCHMTESPALYMEWNRSAHGQ
ncbi:MAG TPA: cytochrome C552, partial [Lamprocystis sp. (in: g-proteobacteria)]|nr:cytochrome C552 [Lamprocystis sp. (in: g-proteobacteria)]